MGSGGTCGIALSLLLDSKESFLKLVDGTAVFLRVEVLCTISPCLLLT